MSVIIKRIELNKREDSPSLAVFLYYGNEDPVKKINAAVAKYVGEKEYYEFIDYNMDNPWTRVILKDIKGFPKENRNIHGREFDVHSLHYTSNVKVLFLSYVDGPDDRPHPIMDIALLEVSGYEGFNAYVESDLSNLWSRLMIFGSNEMQQENFSNQKI